MKDNRMERNNNGVKIPMKNLSSAFEWLDANKTGQYFAVKDKDIVNIYITSDRDAVYVALKFS